MPDLARKIRDGWQAWYKPLIGNGIWVRATNPAGLGVHARQS
jgi:hypothetical protein